jgi:hypothetical protein
MMALRKGSLKGCAWEIMMSGMGRSWGLSRWAIGLFPWRRILIAKLVEILPFTTKRTLPQKPVV